MTTTDREQAQAIRLAFVQSTWHEEIVDGVGTRSSRRSPPWDPTGPGRPLPGPGSFEIPLHAKRLAVIGSYAAIVGAGLVIDGGHLPPRVRRRGRHQRADAGPARHRHARHLGRADPASLPRTRRARLHSSPSTSRSRVPKRRGRAPTRSRACPAFRFGRSHRRTVSGQRRVADQFTVSESGGTGPCRRAWRGCRALANARRCDRLAP